MPRLLFYGVEHACNLKIIQNVCETRHYLKIPVKVVRVFLWDIMAQINTASIVHPHARPTTMVNIVSSMMEGEQGYN